jgi:hypothetical protein
VIKRFVAYRTSVKAQIYGLHIDETGCPGIELELMTSVGIDHLAHVDRLVSELNSYLAHPDPDAEGWNDCDGFLESHDLPTVLADFPTPVAESVRRFLEKRCTESRLGEYGPDGDLIFSIPDYVQQLGKIENDVDELLAVLRDPDPAVAVRLENVAPDDPRRYGDWRPDARTVAPEVSYDDPRPGRWAYPLGLVPNVTWCDWIIGEIEPDDEDRPRGRDLLEGLALVVEAHRAGKLARIHPVTVWVYNSRNEDGELDGGTGTSGWVIEVFDAPIESAYDDTDDED